MTPTQAPAVFLAATPTTRRSRAWIPLVLAIGSAAAYAVFFALPFYVNDLDRYPLAEVAYGMPDPMTQWPHADGGIVCMIFGLGSLATLGVAPFVAAFAIGRATYDLWRERAERDVTRIVTSLLAVAFGAGAFAWLGSPSGRR